MAYTPINWQTGDTITAEKLNKMDNGWGVENAQLFSETVTTADQDGINSGTLAYSSQIDAPTLVVTFDGTDYTCNASDMDWAYVYGGIGAEGPDFTNYPFALASAVNMGGGNMIYTETAGSHAVSVVRPSIMVSSDFGHAVNACIDERALPMICRVGSTTYAEMIAARDARRLMYVYLSARNCVLVNSVPNDSTGVVKFYPNTEGLVLQFDDNGVLESTA